MKKIIAVPQRSYNNPQLQEMQKTDAIYFALEHEAETLVQGL